MSEHQRPSAPWKHGDVGRIQRCVSGGDPYWITVVYRHNLGWFNASGVFHPFSDQPDDSEIELLIRDHEPVGKGSSKPSPSVTE